MEIEVRLLQSHARVPAPAHLGDAGADLYAAEAAMILAGERCDVGTGIAVAIPEGYAGFVQPRSGLAFKHGIMVVNSPGLIDAGYRGEVRVSLYNSGTQPFTVLPGDRIAQLVVQPVEHPLFRIVAELPESARGESGFGSSGR